MFKYLVIIVISGDRMKEDIQIDKIETLKNVRTEIGDVSDLMASIKLHGILQPIGLSRNGEKYIVVFGNRRFHAMKKLGWLKIPAENYVLLPDNITANEFQVYNTVENIMRKDISPIELGKQCYDLVKSGMNVSEVAVLFSTNKENVKKHIEIYEQIPEKHRSIVGYINRNKAKHGISVAVASHIAHSKLGRKGTSDLLDLARQEELSGDNIDLVIRSMKRGKTLDESKKLLETHSVRNIRFVVDSDLEAELMKKYGVKSPTHLYTGIVRGKFPQNKKLVV